MILLADSFLGDGEYLTGVIGTETVTLAGIAVPKQTVALVTSAAWYVSPHSVTSLVFSRCSKFVANYFTGKVTELHLVLLDLLTRECEYSLALITCQSLINSQHFRIQDFNRRTSSVQPNY